MVFLRSYPHTEFNGIDPVKKSIPSNTTEKYLHPNARAAGLRSTQTGTKSVLFRLRRKGMFAFGFFL